MAQPTDESTMTSLGELMRLEHDRIEQARSRRMEEETAHRQRVREAQLRAEAETAERAARAERVRQQEERRAREVHAKAESERSDRELRVRLEVEHARRDAEQSARLAHARRLAELDAESRRRRLSPGTAVALVALALGGVAAMGVLAHLHVQHTAVAPDGPARDDGLSAIRAENDGLRRLIAQRAAAARPVIDPSIPLPSPRPAPDRLGGRPHSRPWHPRPGPAGLEGLDGPDPVTQGGN